MNLRSVARLGTAALLLVAVAAGTPSVAGASPASPTTVGTGSLHLIYHGASIPSSALATLQQLGRALFVAYDGESAKQGYGHAFDTRAELDNYSSQLTGQPASFFAPPTTIDETPEQVAQHMPQPSSGPQTQAIAQCPNLNTGIRMYEHSNCGGSYLAMLRTDQIPRMSTYGWDDRISSVDIQYAGCIITATFYGDINYQTGQGVFRYYGEAGAYASYNFTSPQNDKVSSAQTVCS